MIPLPKPLNEVIATLWDAGVRPILVGGFVRDALTGNVNPDIDIELYNVATLEQIETLLRPFGKLNLVGKSFGVFKLSLGGYKIDFSPPRTESKRGFGHKGFDVTWHSDIDFESAARRRDFTINAIGYDPIGGRFLDPFGGIGDLSSGRLRCVDPETFVDDPLRVLRAVQFAARFDLTCDTALLELCRTMIAQGALEELPKERIFEEFKKLLLLSPRPSLGLKLLKEIGALAFFTPMEQFDSTPQDYLSHPEGDVWTHVLMSVDVMAAMRSGKEQENLILMFAVLLHDIGKPLTTIVQNGKLNAPRHAEEGVEIAREWLEKITGDKTLIEGVLPLVRYHGWPRKLCRSNASDSDILRLSTEVCIDRLIRVAEADFFGRAFVGDTPESFEAGIWLREKAARLGVLYAPPKPLLMGRDLIDAGMAPSEAFKLLLDKAYEAQLDRRITTRDEALEWLAKQS
ncbi:MAG: HD domain-containing protein [Campylobacterota bacterium]